MTAAQLDPDLQPVELIGRFVARSLTRDLARHGDPRVALYELQKFRVRARRLLEDLGGSPARGPARGSRSRCEASPSSSAPCAA